MKRKCLPMLVAFMLALSTCNDREDYFASTIKNVTVTLESPLTACTPTYPGFINLDYGFNIVLKPEYAKAEPLPLLAQFTCEDASSLELSFGNKKYSPGDTIMFKSFSKKMMLTVSKPGTYRFLIQFFKETQKDEILGKYEFTFVIGTPDLNIYIVVDGKRIDHLYEQPNFLETEGEFIVRVLSEKEELNKGRLTLTTNITGSSVQVLNWNDRESKISQSDDLPQTVDFSIQYKNVQIGKTKFVFTAASQNSNAALRDSVNIVENKPGNLTLATTYNEEKKYYSRQQLWVGQTDSVDYIIQKDPESGMNSFRIMFEMKDPTKLWFFNTGDESKQNASTIYETNKWHDFSEKMTGKLYYVFPSPQTYQDTVYLSLQNSTQGSIAKYKLFLSCKQSEDFNFNVIFKPELVNGYDEIKLSELRRGIDDLLTLRVVDENSYSKFDYRIGAEGMKGMQTNIKQTFTKEGYSMPTNLPYGEWLAREFGNLTTTKNFEILCEVLPNDDNADGYIGMFNWTYDVERMSDQKRKSVTRQIKIIDDRLSFLVDLAPGNSRESAYQNETVTAYQLKYQSPSASADEYQLTVTSSDEDVADVYLMNKDLTFRKATFGTAGIPPASHNTEGSMLAVSEIGKMQIKGKQPGAAVLSFSLKHLASGATGTITKTVTTVADPVLFVIEPAPTLDAMSKERAAIPFGGQFHAYQNPRFKIRLKTSVHYAGNTASTAEVVFSTSPSLTNVATLSISGGSSGNIGFYHQRTVAYGEAVDLAYETDYFVSVTSPGYHPWNIPVGSEQFVNVKMTTATDQETQIEAEYNNEVKYTLRAYHRPSYTITAEAYQESASSTETVEISYDKASIDAASVTIFPNYSGEVISMTCDGTMNVRNLSLVATWNDGNELYGSINFINTAGIWIREYTEGGRMELIQGYPPPSNPEWNSFGPGVTVTYYFAAAKATVRDNWNYPQEVNVLIPPKVVYGTR